MNNENKIPESVISIFSSRVDALLKGFTKINRSSTLKDFGEQAVSVLQIIFPESSPGFAHCPAGKKEWMVVAGSENYEIQALNIRSEPTSVACESGVIQVNQKLPDNSFIALVLLNRNSVGSVSDLDLITLRLVGQLLENAYSNMILHRKEKDLIFSLNHRILQLNSLIETGIEVEKLDQTSSPHHLALIRAASLTNASYAALHVTSGKQIKEKYYFPEHTQDNIPTGNSNRIIADFTFRQDTYKFELFNKESRSGNVAFDETDQLLLDALAKQVYASLENRYLHQETLEKQRIEQEISVAAAIQKRIIPVALPVIWGYDLAGINIPSKSVGGDYFDCLPLIDGRYLLIVADVAGKGISAALLVSSLHAYLTAYSESSFALPDLVSRLNNALCLASTDDKFVTAFIVLLNPITGEFEYVNAGHNPGYVITNNRRLRQLEGSGLPLGMFPKSEYSSNKSEIRNNAQLFLYTDGVTEAQNEAGEYFDQVLPLNKYLSKQTAKKSEELISNLVRDLKVFTGSAPQYDDITVLLLKRL